MRSLLMPTSLLGLARTNDFAQHSHLSAANRAIFIASMHLCHSPTFKNRKPWHTPGNVKLLLPAHAFAMASPKTSGQQLWLRKSADTSSHPPISLIRRASPLLCSSAPPQIPNSSSGNATATALALAAWCAPSLSSSPDSARNDHPEPPPQTAILPSQTFHRVLRIISSLVAESLKKPLCC